jgi:Protein of unknown function (DUF3405)
MTGGSGASGVAAQRPISEAVLWFTHLWGPELEVEFERVRALEAVGASGGGTCDVWMLLDGRTPGAAELAARYPRTHRFDQERMFKLPYPRLTGHGLINHHHFPVLDFFLAHPDYDRYWVVEYDVRFTGNWSSFMGAFRGFDHDFVTSHLRRYQEEPRWPWWTTLSHPTQSVPREASVRCFNVVYRISNRALRYLHESQVDGWRGYPEVSFPTLLLRHGYTLLDIGGSGEFVAPGYENRFYTSRAARDGYMGYFGSVRYRPARAAVGSKADTLYHPVKLRSSIESPLAKLKVAARTVVGTLRSGVRRRAK